MQSYNWDVDFRKKRSLDDSVIVFLGSQFSEKKKNQTKTKTKKQNIGECLFGKSISDFGCFEKSETLVYHAEYFWYEVIPKTSESKKMWRLDRELGSQKHGDPNIIIIIHCYIITTHQNETNCELNNGF